jgi:23S rRNA (cytidine2498-2'-O)-methyltransferase
MSERPRFLFITCQAGAQQAVKGELARRWPEFQFAFSRPGFLTFKLPEDCKLPPDFTLGAVFARAHGFSLGAVNGDDPDVLARGVWTLMAERPWQRIHVWERDAASPGEHEFEPGLTAAAAAAYEALVRNCPEPGKLAARRGQTAQEVTQGGQSHFLGEIVGSEGGTQPAEKIGTVPCADWQQPARPGQAVLDCILLDPGRWWVGYHRAKSVPSQWPGGLMPLVLPPDAVSRAWLKMEEALRWARLPIPPKAHWAEIGSAPGGSSQALLQHGYCVTGIDPAAMDPRVLAHPDFVHIRRRSSAVRRRDFRKVRWLAADMNVPPGYTLDAVESIVTHAEVNIRGMLLTLKLPQWKLADQVPAYLDRIRSWGYNQVFARQLQHNRREFCVAALQQPFRKKSPWRSVQ